MIELTDKPIDAIQVIESVQCHGAGAVVPFIGTVRKEEGLAGLFYECHTEMAEKIFEKICVEVLGKWPVEKISVVHRTGWVPVGEASVVIAISAPHRKEAFEACRFVIEEIKKEVPIWKERENHAQN
ncbi:MAG: molybdenum cofactor biosynthesis protein MoaE [bacterium]|nr:molybdenum cofactor biosynthesis protein MoaE [bacterium]